MGATDRHRRDFNLDRVYLDFYQLNETPFALTPDPQFLFLSNTHQQVIEKILYGIQSCMGFILLYGEVGTGKTTICRSVLDHLSDSAETVYIINPSLSGPELISSILEDLGDKSPGGMSKKQLIDRLNHFLLSKSRERPVVVVIDDAQTMPSDALEDLRLLSNLETDKKKLIQMVLVGQPELVEHLSRAELRQLAQRVAINCKLEYLDKGEIEGYIYRRLYVSGEKGRVRFSRGAIKVISRASRGIPRLINKICDYSLTAGYIASDYTIRSVHVKKALTELGSFAFSETPDGSDATRRSKRLKTRRIFLPAALALTICLLGGFFLFRSLMRSPSTASINAAESRMRAGASIDAAHAPVHARPDALKMAEKSEPGTAALQRKDADSQTEANPDLPKPAVPQGPGAETTGMGKAPPESPTAAANHVTGGTSEATAVPAMGASKTWPGDQVSVKSQPSPEMPDSAGDDDRFARYPYALLLGSYKTVENTKLAVDIYSKRVSDVRWSSVNLGEGGTWYRVFTGRFPTRQSAFEFKKENALTDAIVLRSPWTVIAGESDSPEDLEPVRRKLIDNRFNADVLPMPDGGYQLRMGIFVTLQGAETLATEVNRSGAAKVRVARR